MFQEKFRGAGPVPFAGVEVRVKLRPTTGNGTVPGGVQFHGGAALPVAAMLPGPPPGASDRKSTRLNSSHVAISYAVFCLKKKKETDGSFRRGRCASRWRRRLRAARQ